MPAGSPVHPDGQRCGFDPERLERSDLLVLRGKPGQTRVLDHIVEREQAPHEHAGRRRAAVADVLGSERAIEAPCVDPASTPSHSLPMSVGIQ